MKLLKTITAVIMIMISMPAAFFGNALSTGCCGAPSSISKNIAGVLPAIGLLTMGVIGLIRIHVPPQSRSRAYILFAVASALCALGVALYNIKYIL